MPERNDEEKTLVNTLSGARAFQQFTTEEIHSFLDICEIEEFEEEEIIFVEGNPGDSAYILLEGTVDIVKGVQGGEEELFVRMNPPDSFGEMGFISEYPRSGTARCHTEAKVLAIPKFSFDKRLQSEDIISLKFVRNIAAILATRLYHTNQAVVKLRDELQKEGVDDWAQHDLLTIQEILYKGLPEQE